VAITILSIGLLVFAGHFLTGFFERTKVPDVLILMLAGIVLGPVFHVVSPDDFGKVGPVFTTLALIIILFEGGIHLNIRDLGAAAGDTLVISLATFALTVLLVTYAVDLLLPVDPFSALLVGMILGGTSSAVVVPLIRILSPADRPRTVLLLESALTDVLAVVLSLGLMRALASDAAFSAGSMTMEVASSFLVAALMGALGAFIWSAILDKIRQLPNTVFTTVAYVLILYGLTELWGYSGAIASLSALPTWNEPSLPRPSFWSRRFSSFSSASRSALRTGGSSRWGSRPL
jgi:NhaP-type Na+/H+ or K+/H+ antiporter